MGNKIVIIKPKFFIDNLQCLSCMQSFKPINLKRHTSSAKHKRNVIKKLKKMANTIIQ